MAQLEHRRRKVCRAWHATSCLSVSCARWNSSLPAQDLGHADQESNLLSASCSWGRGWALAHGVCSQRLTHNCAP